MSKLLLVNFISLIKINMQNKKIIVSVIVCVVIAGISFWGGMKYGKSKSSNTASSFNRSQGGQGNFGGRTGGQGTRNGVGLGGGFVSGQVLSMDAKSLTVQLSNGGSKIVFFTPTTKVEKTVDGTTSDVAIGKQVMITGATNPDGSVNATSIQMRPVLTIPKAAN